MFLCWLVVVGVISILDCWGCLGLDVCVVVVFMVGMWLGFSWVVYWCCC